ncbi:hypothetical protein CGZ80_13545 [Rhodopirellula sp. MGV]|nr:hypothetical protein CGZ80_13545 [Rhodopirellula sp. MGV]
MTFWSRSIVASVLAALVSLSFTATVNSQDRSISQLLKSGSFQAVDHSKQSERGKPILSFPCDPLMSVEQERQLLETLSKPSPLKANAITTLNSLAQALSEHCPVVIDRRSLDEYGMRIDMDLSKNLLLDNTSKEPVSNEQSVDQPASNQWWAAASEPTSNDHGLSLLGDLVQRLDGSDLEIVLYHSRVVITTIEAAEELNIVRMYEISPLKGLDSLVDTITQTFDPDRWEILGGQAMMRRISTDQNDWLIVSAPTMTQLKVQAFLNRINQ